jgi:hypothetical protein
MTARPDDARSWMSPAQQLLVRAALLDGDAALDAWGRWRAGNALEEGEVGNYFLLPAVYRNLSRLPTADPCLPKLRGVYRHNWCHNQLALHRLAEVLRVLCDAGVTATVLEGAALLLFHYRDPGARMMGDVDLLVRRRDVPAAAAVLARAGWTSLVALRPEALPFFCAACFCHPDRAESHLHWRPYTLDGPAEIDDQFHARTLPCEIGGVPARAPDPTDMLLFVCLHATRQDAEAACRWVLDAISLITRATPPIDWDALLTRAEAARVVPPLYHTLDYLRREFAAPVPESFLRRAAAVPADSAARFMDGDRPRGLIERVRWRGRLFAQVARGRGERLTPLRALRYYVTYQRSVWNLRQPWHVLPRTIREVTRVLLGLKKL